MFKTVSSIIGVALVVIYVAGSGLWVNTGDNCDKGISWSWTPSDALSTLGYYSSQFKLELRQT